MKTSALTHKRRLRWIALGLAVAALVAPAAYSHDGPRAPCSVLNGMVYSGADHAGPATPCYVLQEIVYGPGSSGIQDWQLRYGSDGTSPSVATPAESPALETAPVLPAAAPLVASGFDWSDAGIGAATTLALLLVVGSATILVQRRGRLAI